MYLIQTVEKCIKIKSQCKVLQKSTKEQEALKSVGAGMHDSEPARRELCWWPIKVVSFV